MKIAHRLAVLAGFTSAGLIAVAGVGLFAVKSIQSDLRGLTSHATPLQVRTYELQERTERIIGALLKLSITHESEEIDRTIASIDAEMREFERLQQEIRQLEPSTNADSAEFRAAQELIARTVRQRLAEQTSYKAETETARKALDQAEQAVAASRAAVATIETDAAKAADQAQDASRALGNTMKFALTAQGRLKELAIIVNETDTVGNRFRLAPLRERSKAHFDSIVRIESAHGGVDPLKDIKAAAASAFDALTRDGTGLFALRVQVLAAKPEAEAAYASHRRAILATLDEQSAKLNTMIDALEVQIVKQRQTLEAALRFRNEPGGIVVLNDTISLDMKEMTAGIRMLMLAANEAEAGQVLAQLDKLLQKMHGNLERLRAALLKIGRANIARNAEAAATAMKTVGAAIGKVGTSKRSVLASEIALRDALSRLKTFAAQQGLRGQEQVKSINVRQQEVSAAVDQRVGFSLALIIAISGLIIAVAAVLSVSTIRTVTRRLDEAVCVAEAVSRGELDRVPDAKGNDETARLLAALATMVGTLTRVVAQIKTASESIDICSKEISNGNHDLSSRTEQQASNLQQTAASMGQLSSAAQHNAETAHDANALSAGARDVASEGGAAVTQVVTMMGEIEQSSRRIAEIIGVIDGIAFQTNILALNAAVEAARAGAQGRGFAVVASEVRALAQKSSQAADEIRRLIEESVARVDQGARLVDGAGAKMKDIVERVCQVTDQIAQISHASQQQLESLKQVNGAIASLDEMTQRNAALAEQSRAAASGLVDQSRGLADVVSVFKLREGETQALPA